MFTRPWKIAEARVLQRKHTRLHRVTSCREAGTDRDCGCKVTRSKANFALSSAYNTAVQILGPFLSSDERLGHAKES
jgi:hypothetical protein